LRFLTPEEYFRDESPEPFSLSGLDVGKLTESSRSLLVLCISGLLAYIARIELLFNPTNTPLLPTDTSRPEVVVFVGYFDALTPNASYLSNLDIGFRDAARLAFTASTLRLPDMFTWCVRRLGKGCEVQQQILIPQLAGRTKIL
jgi:hypothetical protein